LTQALYLRAGAFDGFQTEFITARLLKPEQGPARRPRLLLVSSLISLPYRVLRVAAAAGADVYVLGTPASRSLRYSRDCKRFILTRYPIVGERDVSLADEINRAAREHAIDMVLPGDAQATRSLIAVKELIDAPVFPTPSLRKFDYLNDKWRFTELCESLGMAVPRSVLAADAATLRAQVESGVVALPAIVKPVNRDGGLGVLKLEPSNWREQIARVDYAPIIAQEFIPGRDIGASLYAERGEIRAFIAHELKRATYRALDDERIVTALSRIATHLELDGVYNFDMRLAPDGTIHYLECNPRFFYKMDLSMVAGVNFIRPGLPGRAYRAPKRGATVRLPKALALAMLTPWTATGRDFRMLAHLWSDPLAQLRQMLGFDFEGEKEAKSRHFATPAMAPPAQEPPYRLAA
jgi:predicted ATP-grasp superfamily ATP-dependent carboligase